MNIAYHCPNPTAAAAPGLAFDDERLARIAARRAFVEMKTSFMRAAADIDGVVGRRLQLRIRHATEAVHLWRLRAVLLASLPDGHDRTAIHKVELHRQLDSVFSDSATAGNITNGGF